MSNLITTHPPSPEPTMQRYLACYHYHDNGSSRVRELAFVASREEALSDWAAYVAEYRPTATLTALVLMAID